MIKKKSVAREWIESIIIAFILAMVIRTFVIQAFKIPTGSMRPTLLEGDLILVNKFIYGAKMPLPEKYAQALFKRDEIRLPAVRDLRRGDVVVFIYPEDPSKDFIKRMVGLPGDTVEIRKGTIYINQEPLQTNEFNQRYYYNYGDFAQTGEKIIVPADSYFVLGDNSASSKDSRYWGFVPRKNILGKALVIYWPLHRIRLIK